MKSLMPMSTLSRRMHFTGACLVVLLLAGLALPPIALADDGSSDLAEMSLEDLLNVEVTSVSKRTERLSDAAAAIYVLTGKDIQRSGARTIADALRLVPGLHVANIDANTWAVSSRGFNGNFANKLLVLVDGRTVYSPLFSGVWWDAQDLVLDNIDRIEVIRGPGATLWGANAVNGVINIITKPAQETQGGYFELGGGTEDKGAGALQYATPVGSSGAVRFYAKSFDRDTYGNSAGLQAKDDWSISRGGLSVRRRPGQPAIAVGAW